MALRLYVIGGQQRELRPITAGDDWYQYRKGLIVEVDPDGGDLAVQVEYVSPPEARPDQDPAILFKSSSVRDGRLFACTQTEILVYSVPDFRQVGYLSLPLFNDIHHVVPTDRGSLLVANTGLDMVLELSLDGRILQEWGALGQDPWERFSRDVDYRKVPTTKPHHSHPNQIFCIGDEIWTTRFEQRDAVSLTSGRRIDIGLERVHDGFVHRGHVYFTTVDGKVVVVDTVSLETVETIDLVELVGGSILLGWTRGLYVDDRGIWVGFSRIRPTKFRQNVAWVLRGFKEGRPTHIAHFDLERRTCTRWIDVEPSGLSVVFSILQAPTTAGDGPEDHGAG
jgi:hypothetical protein